MLRVCGDICWNWRTYVIARWHVIFCENSCKVITPTRYLPLENSFPDPFFHSREFGNGRSHSWDSRAPGNDVYCRTTSAVALWKAVKQTPECTTFSVNVNVHIASISPGRPLIKCEWIAAPGFFFWLFHRWQSNAHDDLGPSPFPSRFRQICQVRWRNEWTESRSHGMEAHHEQS